MLDEGYCWFVRKLSEGDIMKVKMGDVLAYKDSQISTRYGKGVVTSISPEEYSILWTGRGLVRYKRAILDDQLEEVFQPVENDENLPRQRYLQLGSSKPGIPFNEHYDRSRVESLCEKLKLSGARKARDVAQGLAAEVLAKKLASRGSAKGVLRQLAELCAGNSSVRDAAQNISGELFFGYVLQRSDFGDA
jgi:hypothetical protein